jgi:hypothetical protein
VIGDLIAQNVVLLIVNVTDTLGNAPTDRYWIYHVDTNQFEPFNPAGGNPLAGLLLNNPLQDIDLCHYQAGKAVLVRGLNGIATWLFDYPTRTWTPLQISQPGPDLNTTYGQRLWGITLANMNGKVYLTSEGSSIWELTPGTNPQWRNIGLSPGLGGTSSGAVSGRGFPGLLGMISDGLPRGAGFLAGGRVWNQPKSDIWQFVASGVVETICDGQPALTLGGGATQASFRVADFALPWQVAKILANPIGHLPPGSIRLAYSFNGVDWQDVPRDQIQTVLASSNPATRRLRITLIGAGSTKPCLIGLNEQFEQVGGPGFTQLVIRVNHPDATLNATRGWFLTREGQVTVENAVARTTPDKCLLFKSTGQGAGNAPLVQDYVNKRLIHKKYTVTKAGGSDPSLPADFPVDPGFMQAFKIAAGGAMSTLNDPAFNFDQPIVVTGLVDGESARVEIEA